MYYGEGRTRFKDDLRILVSQKLRELAVFPVNITSSLKDRIKNVQEDFLELRQSNKFTKEKGIEILIEIDSINDALESLPKKIKEEEDRKRKSTKPKSKRKIIKHKK